MGRSTNDSLRKTSFHRVQFHFHTWTLVWVFVFLWVTVSAPLSSEATVKTRTGKKSPAQSNPKPSNKSGARAAKKKGAPPKKSARQAQPRKTPPKSHPIAPKKPTEEPKKKDSPKPELKTTDVQLHLHNATSPPCAEHPDKNGSVRSSKKFGETLKKAFELKTPDPIREKGESDPLFPLLKKFGGMCISTPEEVESLKKTRLKTTYSTYLRAKGQFGNISKELRQTRPPLKEDRKKILIKDYHAAYGKLRELRSSVYSSYDEAFKSKWAIKTGCRDRDLKDQNGNKVLLRGKPVTCEDMRVLDGVMRTLVGEGESCEYSLAPPEVKQGNFSMILRSQYDRYILAKLIKDKDRTDPKYEENYSRYTVVGRPEWPQSSLSSLWEEVISAPAQFQNWDLFGGPSSKKLNPRVGKTLCPDESGVFSAHSESRQREIWEGAGAYTIVFSQLGDKEEKWYEELLEKQRMGLSTRLNPIQGELTEKIPLIRLGNTIIPSILGYTHGVDLPGAQEISGHFSVGGNRLTGRPGCPKPRIFVPNGTDVRAKAIRDFIRSPSGE